MQPETQRVTQSRAGLWAGRVLSALGVLFLLMDATMKLLKVQPVLDTFPKIGWPVSLVTPLGILLLLCVMVYVIPQTSLLGAVLLTGYLGGALATPLRISDPLFSHILFPTYIALLWGGLFLREQRLQALLPLRR